MVKKGNFSIAILLFFTAAVPGSLESRVLLSIPEALQKAFPPNFASTRQRAFLSANQAAAFKNKAAGRTALKSRIVTRFEVGRRNRIIGFAYLDTHRVRSGKETILIVLNARGAVKNIFLLNFQGDSGYEPKPQWLKKFSGLTGNKRLRLKHEIDAMSGASITSDKVIRAVRRVLILHSIFNMD